MLTPDFFLMKCLRSQGFELGQGTPCPYIFSRLIAFFCVSRLFDELRSQLFEQNIGLERLHDLH